MQSLKSNRDLKEELVYPNNLAYFDLELIAKDQQEVESAKSSILDFNNHTYSRFHRVRADIFAKELVQDVENFLEEKLAVRQSLEKEINAIDAILNQVSRDLGNYNLKVSNSIHKPDSKDQYPKDLNYYDLDLLNKDLSELSYAINVRRKLDPKKKKVESLIGEFKSSKELNSHLKILESKRFSSISCFMPFSKASKSRKFLQRLFVNPLSFKELRQSSEDLIITIQNIESSESKVKTKLKLFFSELSWI